MNVRDQSHWTLARWELRRPWPPHSWVAIAVVIAVSCSLTGMFLQNRNLTLPTAGHRAFALWPFLAIQTVSMFFAWLVSIGTRHGETTSTPIWALILLTGEPVTLARGIHVPGIATIALAQALTLPAVIFAGGAYGVPPASLASLQLMQSTCAAISLTLFFAVETFWFHSRLAKVIAIVTLTAPLTGWILLETVLPAAVTGVAYVIWLTIAGLPASQQLLIATVASTACFVVVVPTWLWIERRYLTYRATQGSKALDNAHKPQMASVEIEWPFKRQKRKSKPLTWQNGFLQRHYRGLYQTGPWSAPILTFAVGMAAVIGCRLIDQNSAPIQAIPFLIFFGTKLAMAGLGVYVIGSLCYVVALPAVMLTSSVRDETLESLLLAVPLKDSFVAITKASSTSAAATIVIAYTFSFVLRSQFPDWVPNAWQLLLIIAAAILVTYFLAIVTTTIALRARHHGPIRRFAIWIASVIAFPYTVTRMHRDLSAAIDEVDAAPTNFADAKKAELRAMSAQAR